MSPTTKPAPCRRDDAETRGWDSETARHQRVITSLEAQLLRLKNGNPTCLATCHTPEGRLIGVPGEFDLSLGITGGQQAQELATTLLVEPVVGLGEEAAYPIQGPNSY